MPYTVGRYGRYGMAYSMRHIAILPTYVGRMLDAILASNVGGIGSACIYAMAHSA